MYIMETQYIVWLIGLATLLLFAFTALARRKPRTALNPDKFISLTLIKRIEISKDSFVFRFAFVNRKHVLGLPVGHHVQLRAVCVTPQGNGSETVQHSYTPITGNEETGYVDFLIKVYFANVHPRYPGGGRLSQHMYNMHIGDTIEARGPKGNFIYDGHGIVRVNTPGKGWQTTRVDAFAMVAGGTGITPLLQVIQAIYKDPSDTTHVYLLYSNHTEDDILMRGQLDALTRHQAGRFHVWYTLTQETPSQWPYGVTRIDEEMMRCHLPVLAPSRGSTAPPLPPPTTATTPSTNTSKDGYAAVYALMCGPSALVQQVAKPNFEKLGYTASNMFAF